jgi:hypothetical protein
MRFGMVMRLPPMAESACSPMASGRALPMMALGSALACSRATLADDGAAMRSSRLAAALVNGDQVERVAAARRISRDITHELAIVEAIMSSLHRKCPKTAEFSPMASAHGSRCAGL